MDAKLAQTVRSAAALALRRVSGFPKAVAGDDLPWVVIEAFDADIRGSVERDRRIEEERDRVLIAAVDLAETRPEDGPEAIAAARAHLEDAIAYLEQSVLRFGIVSRQGARLGYGEAGQSVSATP